MTATRVDWILRPLVWFTTASIVNVVLHEWSHALTAHAFGKSATMFQYWVNWDWPSATAAQRAAVGAAGPAFSLALGLLCLAAYTRLDFSAAGLPLLFLSTIGLAIFFGNLMSTAFVGDFSNAAIVLELPRFMRFAASAAGAIAGAAVLFWQGRELRRSVPHDLGRVAGALGAVGVPVAVGTTLIVAINQPTPADVPFASARIAEASFEIFALLGAMTVRPIAARDVGSSELTWIDVAVLAAVVVPVRVMAQGIALAP